MEALLLGRVDEHVAFTAAQQEAYLDLYHHPAGFVNGQRRFRDDTHNCWRPWEVLPGRRITTLTHFLQQAGFMPHASHDGVFGYVTQAAVRLFQEYVRTGEQGDYSLGGPPLWPDGVVGPFTESHIARWRVAGLRCRWGEQAGATEDYSRWMDWLARIRARYLAAPGHQLRVVSALPKRGDTLLPNDWSFNPDEPHLIGLRYHDQRPRQESQRRAADDLFVLLLSGRTFYFSGSVDANPSSRREAYLIEGQHRYQFNWHNVGPGRRERIYKAARPATQGVIVARDIHGHNALTDDNLLDGIDPHPNPTINIHWNGLGISNWSAGCQVISGSSYCNDLGEWVDCGAYTARNDGERGGRRRGGGPRLTMGAYTVLSDLLLCYTPPAPGGKKPTFRYTLLHNELVEQIPGLDITHLQPAQRDTR